MERSEPDQYFQTKIQKGLIRGPGPVVDKPPRRPRRKKARNRRYCLGCMVRMRHRDPICPICLNPTVPHRELPVGTRPSSLPRAPTWPPMTTDPWEERRAAYTLYITRSPTWQEKRRQVIERDGGCCVRCGNPGREVHHLTYRRLFRESLLDLELLCYPCHEAEHRHRPPD